MASQRPQAKPRPRVPAQKKGTCSLRKACIHRAIAIRRTIDDFGDMPFHLAEPILRAIDDPEQLHKIEIKTPHFIGLLDDMWREILNKELTSYKKNPIEPKNSASWYKVYKKIKAIEDSKAEEDILMLKAQMQECAEKKASRSAMTTTAIVKQRANQRAVLTKPGDQSVLRFNGGSRTKMKTGQDVIARARREARERSMIMGSKSKLAQPIKSGNDTKVYDPRKSNILFAPTSMVEQHRREQSVPAPQSLRNFNSDKGYIPHKITAEEREKRLREAKAKLNVTTASSSKSSTTTKLPSSPTESLPKPRGPAVKRKRDDDDDLFGELKDDSDGQSPIKKQQTSPSSSSPTRKSPSVPAMYIMKPSKKTMRK